MRDSLHFVARAPELEASEDLTAQIMMRARSVRHDRATRQRRWSAVGSLVRGFACAAGILVVAGLYFGAALESDAALGMKTGPAVKRMADVVPSVEAVRKAAEEVRTLEAAVSNPSKKPQTLWERERRRVVRVLDADIAAALAALERNPGCTRATNLVSSNVQRQAETLRTLYIERSL